VATTSNAITFKKLRDGSWGLIGPNLTEGSTVRVAKRDGTAETKTVGAIVWRGEDGTTIARVAGGGESAPRAQTSRPRGRGGRYECDECGDRVSAGTRCWETGATH
jgi:hypothetical protein